jgi:hypothetical protein
VQQPPAYPVRFSVDYPDRDLDRTSTLLRIFYAIPIVILLSTVSGGGATSSSTNNRGSVVPVGAGGLLFLGPLLMVVFRQKYPHWWFDWNLELQRFGGGQVARTRRYGHRTSSDAALSTLNCTFMRCGLVSSPLERRESMPGYIACGVAGASSRRRGTPHDLTSRHT